MLDALVQAGEEEEQEEEEDDGSDSLFLGRRSIVVQNRKLVISELLWTQMSRLDKKIVI